MKPITRAALALFLVGWGTVVYGQSEALEAARRAIVGEAATAAQPGAEDPGEDPGTSFVLPPSDAEPDVMLLPLPDTAETAPDASDDEDEPELFVPTDEEDPAADSPSASSEAPVIRSTSRMTQAGGSNLRVVIHEPEVVRETGIRVAVADGANSAGATLAMQREIARIKALPPQFIPIQGAPVQEAIRLIAEAAGMSYVSPENEAFADQTVSLRMEGNPWDLLQVLSESFGIGLEFRNNVWYFYTISIDELVTRAYRLRYNDREEVTLSAPTLNDSLSTTGSVPGTAGEGGESDDDSGGSGRVEVTVSAERIIGEIETILETPTTGLEIVEAGEFMVGQDGTGDLGVPGWNPSIEREGDGPRGSVVWDSDNRRFLVTATRQQHKRIERLLEMLDRPQKLVKISSILVETDINPVTSFGVDWGLDMGVRWDDFDGSSDLTVGPAGAGFGLEAARTITNGEFDELLPNPNGALFTINGVRAQLNALKEEGDSRVRQRPTVVTINNRPVSLRAVVQTPVQAGGSTSSSSVSSTTASSVSYIDVGTTVAIYPKIVESLYGERSVRLSLVLNVSSIVDFVSIEQRADGDGDAISNEFPVIASREYYYEVIVPDGYTLAIGGLTESRRVTNDRKVPLLGDIPVIGNLFKSRTDEIEERNLIAYITPTILEPNAPEIERGGGTPIPSHRDVDRDFFESRGESLFRNTSGTSWSYDDEDSVYQRREKGL